MMVGIGRILIVCIVDVVIFNLKILCHHLNFPIVYCKMNGRICHVIPQVKTKLVLSLKQFVIIMHKIATRTPPVRLDKYGVILSDLGVLVVWSI